MVTPSARTTLSRNVKTSQSAKKISIRNWFIASYIVFQSIAFVIFQVSLDDLDTVSKVWMRQQFLSERSTQGRVQQQQDFEWVPYIMEEKMEDVFSYVRQIESVGRPLVFFHIPKTAGTAVELAAGKVDISWGSCLFNHKPKRSICNYPPGELWPPHVGWWHLPRHLFPIANADPYQGSESFAIIRDPYDRMISEFYYICTLKVLEWRPNQCDRSRLFEKDYMNTWLMNKLRDREKDSALAYLSDNGHFTSQYEFVVAPNQVRMVDYVLRLDESLSVQFSQLMQSFGLGNIGLKKQNALGAAVRNEKSHLGVDDLDNATLSLIHKLYKDDFELGYDRKGI